MNARPRRFPRLPALVTLAALAIGCGEPAATAVRSAADAKAAAATTASPAATAPTSSGAGATTPPADATAPSETPADAVVATPAVEGYVFHKKLKSTSPISGKTCVVEAKKGAITVRTDRDAPAPADEAALVKKDFKHLGKADSMQSALPDSPIRIGQSVDSLAKSLSDRFTDDDTGDTKTTVSDVSVRLGSVGEDDGSKTGVFKTSLTLLMEKSGLVIAMRMSGEVKVRMEDGFPLAMTFQAPVTVRSADGAAGPKIVGSGSTTLSSLRQVL